MDTVFLVTLLIIFLGALTGAYFHGRSLDRCLKDMSGFPVTVEMKDGRRHSGTLAVYPTGIEVIFSDPQTSPGGHPVGSRILFQDQLGSVQAIYRSLADLDEAERRRRLQRIEMIHGWSYMRRTVRRLRNFVNTFRDAFNHSMGALIAQARTQIKSTVLASQEPRLGQIAQTVIGAVANQYEPILEKYIGMPVIAEEERPEKRVIEHFGVLQEYTAAWIEVLSDSRDICLPRSIAIVRHGGAGAHPRLAAAGARRLEREAASRGSTVRSDTR